MQDYLLTLYNLHKELYTENQSKIIKNNDNILDPYIPIIIKAQEPIF